MFDYLSCRVVILSISSTSTHPIKIWIEVDIDSAVGDTFHPLNDIQCHCVGGGSLCSFIQIRFAKVLQSWLTSSAFAFIRHEMLNKTVSSLPPLFDCSGVVCGGLVTSVPPSSGGVSLALSGSQWLSVLSSPAQQADLSTAASWLCQQIWAAGQAGLPSPASPASPALTQTKASNVNSWESISNLRSAFHPGRWTDGRQRSIFILARVSPLSQAGRGSPAGASPPRARPQVPPHWPTSEPTPGRPHGAKFLLLGNSREWEGPDWWSV